jgi:hypothetical protein
MMMNKYVKIKTLIDEERSNWEAKENAELDLRIAQRVGNKSQTEAASKAQSELSTKWYNSRLAAKAAVEEFCTDIGITVNDLKGCAF